MGLDASAFCIDGEQLVYMPPGGLLDDSHEVQLVRKLFPSSQDTSDGLFDILRQSENRTDVFDPFYR